MRSTIIATPDPPPVGIANPIHADDGAAGAGYQGALVAGVRTYGWVADALRRHFGERWLDSGWADITLRRPLYAGEELTIELTEAGLTGHDAALSVRAAVADRVVLDGQAGLGEAPWFNEIDPPPFAPAAEPPAIRATYTLDSVPLRQPLHPLGAWVSEDGARRLATDDLGLTTSDHPSAVIHPWFLAGRMAPLTRHNFTYGPTIHVRTQIQHRSRSTAGQQIVIGAHIVDAFDRKDHWYQVLDGSIWGASGDELARLRHTTIFRPRGTVTPPPIVSAELA